MKNDMNQIQDETKKDQEQKNTVSLTVGKMTLSASGEARFVLWLVFMALIVFALVVFLRL